MCSSYQDVFFLPVDIQGPEGTIYYVSGIRYKNDLCEEHTHLSGEELLPVRIIRTVDVLDAGCPWVCRNTGFIWRQPTTATPASIVGFIENTYQVHD